MPQATPKPPSQPVNLFVPLDPQTAVNAFIGDEFAVTSITDVNSYLSRATLNERLVDLPADVRENFEAQYDQQVADAFEKMGVPASQSDALLTEFNENGKLEFNGQTLTNRAKSFRSKDGSGEIVGFAFDTDIFDKNSSQYIQSQIVAFTGEEFGVGRAIQQPESLAWDIVSP